MRALVTGGSGFLGSYMVHELAARGWTVLSTGLPQPNPKSPGATNHVAWRNMDVRDASEVATVVKEFQPDIAFHFAGQAYVIPSWQDPRGTFETNVMGTLNLAEALRIHAPHSRLAFAGSGTEYGAATSVPTPEDAPLRPTSPYAASKAAADLLCYQYFESSGVPVIRYRIFGTTGVGKRGDSINDFASQIATLENQPSPRRMGVGKLDRTRDVSDVRDAVRAMILVAQEGTPGEAYNIGSGKPREVRETLEALLSLAGQSIEPVEEAARVRLADEPVHLADVSKIMRLGWAPRIPFETTLSDILENWRAQVGSAPG